LAFSCREEGTFPVHRNLEKCFSQDPDHFCLFTPTALCWGGERPAWNREEGPALPDPKPQSRPGERRRSLRVSRACPGSCPAGAGRGCPGSPTQRARGVLWARWGANGTRRAELWPSSVSGSVFGGGVSLICDARLFFCSLALLRL